jgi:hypothetical protein
MIVRRLVSRRAVRKGSTEEEPRRKRAARFLLVICTVGLLTGIAAWLNVWPFGNVQAMIAAVFGSGTVQVPAQSVFPAAQPVHKVVDVYDTPPAGHPTSAPPRRTSPTGSPTQEPRESPEPGDH